MPSSFTSWRLSLDHVPCPFCGLLCDDLKVRVVDGAIAVIDRGCDRGRAGFEQPVGGPSMCLVQGQPASLEYAIEQAAIRLQRARQPLLVSGGADVASMRALLTLGERSGAIIDHSNEGITSNVLALQNGGWITTTLTEIRNRADLILCAGTDVVSRFPRFFERCGVGGGMHDEQRPAPELIFLGAQPPLGIAGKHVHWPVDDLAACFATLRALATGRRPDRAPQSLLELTHRVERSSYGVLVWAAADFAAPHADLTIGALCEWLKFINTRSRFAGLPLGGSDGDITALQTATWQTGFPLRTRLTDRGPEYDPQRHGVRMQIASGNADLLLYVSELETAATPPAADIPTVVLGRVGMQVAHCDVFIPVGTPGIDRPGHFFRTDSVVALRMRKLVDRGALDAPHVLARITQALAALQPRSEKTAHPAVAEFTGGAAS